MRPLKIEVSSPNLVFLLSPFPRPLCKLFQDILHDLDVEFSSVSTFAAYERELVERVIPTYYGRFEELDEESAQVLQVRRVYDKRRVPSFLNCCIYLC
jgi:hypothetical protein